MLEGACIHEYMNEWFSFHHRQGKYAKHSGGYKDR